MNHHETEQPHISTLLRLVWVCALACLPARDLSTYSSGEGTPDSGREPDEAADGPGLPEQDRATGSLDAIQRPPYHRRPDVRKGDTFASGTTQPEPPQAADPEPDPSSPAACEGPDVLFDGESASCYRFSAERATWSEARDRCRASGAVLVSLTTLEEDALIGAKATDTIWIGASDTASEGTFVWDSGEPFELERFAEGQPNNLFAVQDCVERRASDGLWYDRDCTLERRYVCEVKGARAL